MVQIVFSRLALFDLKEIVDYIKRDSIKYASAERNRIEQAIDKLQHQPLLGRIVPEIGNERIRELIFKNYRIIYDIVSEEQINILTIHHHARSLSKNSAFGDED